MEQIFSKLKFITHGEGFIDITYDLNLCVEKNNFHKCSYRNLSGGIVSIHSGWKI